MANAQLFMGDVKPNIYLGDNQLGDDTPASPLAVYVGGDNTTEYIDENRVKHIFKRLQAYAGSGAEQTVSDTIEIDFGGYSSARIRYYCVTSNANYGYNVNKYTIDNNTSTAGSGYSTVLLSTTVSAKDTINASVYAKAVSGSSTSPIMYIKDITLYP